MARRRKNEQKCHLFLKNELGLSESVICGILANIEAESDYDEQCGNGGMTYGLFQWYGSLTGSDSRRRNLFEYCGTQTPTTDQQLEFLKYELENYYFVAKVLPKLQELSKEIDNIENADYSARYWCNYFEVPGDNDWNNSFCRKRANQARAYYNFFMSNT